MEALTTRAEQFLDELHALMRAYRDVTGPIDFPDDEGDDSAGGGVGTLDAAALAAGTPVVDVLLAEVMVLTVWIDPGGRPYLSKVCTPTMLPHHQAGLLGEFMTGLVG